MNRQPEIFISYRRQDSQGFAGRLSDGLAEIFGDDAIFRDDEIPSGRDYTLALNNALLSCKVLIVVIGRHWLTARNSSGVPRLMEANDWVHLEIEAAFKRQVWVLPVLVGGAQMPLESELPESLSLLSRQQAFVISDRKWDQDVRQLGALITQDVSSLQERDNKTHHHKAADSLFSVWRRLLEAGTAAVQKRSSPTLIQRLGSFTYRAIKSLLTMVVVLLIINFLIQEFGDAETKRLLKAFLEYLTRTADMVLNHIQKNS